MNRKQRRIEQKQRKLPPHATSPRLQELFDEALRHHQSGRLADAEQRYRRILEQDSSHADSWHLLGVIAGQTGHFDAAVQLIGKAIALNARDAGYYSNQGNAYNALGRPAEAISCFKKSLALRPDYPETLNNLGVALKDQGRREEAITSFRKAIDLQPTYPEALNNLGITFDEMGRLDDAIASYNKAIELRPNFPEALNNIGNSLTSQGRLEEAIAHYQRALFHKPDYVKASSNLLLLLHYSPKYSNLDILKQAKAFARNIERTGEPVPFNNTREPQRRLRVGYVSGDFRTHSVAYFFATVLEAGDRETMEVFCYSNSAIADDMTARLRQAADHWRNIVGIPDNQAASMIRSDNIDILVDLSGHTVGSRLPLFALKPAPIQVTWLGYSGTTGLSSIDYILADSVVVPPGEETAFSETVWRLPDCYLCYSPPRTDSPVAPFPALANGFVTFGSFNNWTKTSAETVAAWAAILRRVDGSRLYLKSKSLADAGCRSNALAQFAAHGIGADRLILEGHLPQSEALAAYNTLDIALDPFPYGGTTTTAEALWMGVPLVTLRGQRWVTRVSASILATIGLTDWVANDVGHYVDTACRLAAEYPTMADMRATLRQRLETSPFCDAPRFTRALEAAFRRMWGKFITDESTPLNG